MELRYLGTVVRGTIDKHAGIEHGSTTRAGRRPVRSGNRQSVPVRLRGADANHALQIGPLAVKPWIAVASPEMISTRKSGERDSAGGETDPRHSRAMRQHRTRNLEIPGLLHPRRRLPTWMEHPRMTEP
jgi:hypothetical protein